MLDYKRAEEMVRELTGDDGVLDYTSEQARLLVQVVRTLARGRPVSAQEIDVIAAEFGWAPEAAHGFLRPLTERDAADAVIGVFPGLSLGNHPHRLSVNGRQMSAWCAEDTLFLPALLGQTAMIESTSPLSRAPVRLTVSPDGVMKVHPVLCENSAEVATEAGGALRPGTRRPPCNGVTMPVPGQP
jgi:hypothetical protein